MKEYWRRIQIVTRPKEIHGFYEYFMDTRKRRFIFFPSSEPQLLKKAIEDISAGRNPSGWILTRPSEKDKNIYVMPFEQNAFYVVDENTFFFPNESILKAWLEWHWQEHKIEQLNENENLFGIPVKHVTGIQYAEKENL